MRRKWGLYEKTKSFITVTALLMTTRFQQAVRQKGSQTDSEPKTLVLLLLLLLMNSVFLLLYTGRGGTSTVIRYRT